MDDTKPEESIASSAKAREGDEPFVVNRRKTGSTLRDLLTELRAQRAGSEFDETGSRHSTRGGRR